VPQLLARHVAKPATTETEEAPAAGGPDAPETDDAPFENIHAALPLVSLVLGIAGVVLGITVIWFFAAIPVGVVSVATGVWARGRLETSEDPRASYRATIGTALGCVAILLGVAGAFFLPRIMDRADRFLSSVQQDVNTDVGTVNGGLTRDVDRLDRTLTRDLRRFEEQNRTDLNSLESRTNASLKALEARSRSDIDVATVAEKRDLATLEAALRTDLRATEKEMHDSDSTLRDLVKALEDRVTALEKKLNP
jgi:hypothetical protein